MKISDFVGICILWCTLAIFVMGFNVHRLRTTNAEVLTLLGFASLIILWPIALLIEFAQFLRRRALNVKAQTR